MNTDYTILIAIFSTIFATLLGRNVYRANKSKKLSIAEVDPLANKQPGSVLREQSRLRMLNSLPVRVADSLVSTTVIFPTIILTRFIKFIGAALLVATLFFLIPALFVGIIWIVIVLIGFALGQGPETITWSSFY